MRRLGILCCLLLFALPLRAESDSPDVQPELAADLLGIEGTMTVERRKQPVPVWLVRQGESVVGQIGSTWEIAGSIGYSGKPLDVLVAVTPDMRLTGAQLVQHNEPILTLGLSSEDIAAFVSAFEGIDLTKPRFTPVADGSGLPDVISRATVTSGVIRDAILRTARTMAAAQSPAGGGVDRVTFRELDWNGLIESGALSHLIVSLDDAFVALQNARRPPPRGDGVFLEMWAGILDPPTIGRNLLGPLEFSKAIAALPAGDSMLLIASRGLHSHRGTAWRRSGTFDRIRIVQDGRRLSPTKDGYTRIDRLAVAGAPEMKEASLFRLDDEVFDSTRPFRVEVTARREADEGAVEMVMPLDHALPSEFVLSPPTLAEPEPLWITAWSRKTFEIAGVIAMLTMLAAILFFQEFFVRRPSLWRGLRIGFLSVTLIWLGWIAGGQLSVVQVVAFLHALLSEFRWETFLIEPVIFLLWGFVALGLLFWGRGVFCGWLCPFGAMQELTSQIAQRLGVPQIAIPYSVHERLWVIKYTLFVAIVALSFYSMEQALVLAEVEPFKTAMSMRFMRAWPFVLFVVLLLVAGLFVERFYCRYLCPLGAGLAIPAKLKLFDWLRRRPQCGRECRLCERKCPVGAIDPIGKINPNECVLCLRCQTIYHDPTTCTVLKARAARQARTGTPKAAP